MTHRVLILVVAACTPDVEDPSSPPADDDVTEETGSEPTTAETSDTGTPPTETTGICPLSALGRSLLEEVVLTHVADAHTMSANYPIDRMAELRLLGSGYGVHLQARVSSECLAPYPWDQGSCNQRPPSGFYVDHDTCYSMGCEAEFVAISQAWATMRPHTEADDRHPFTYDLDWLPGLTGVYDPNPLRTWRMDAHDRSAYHVTTTLDDALAVTHVASGEVVDLHQSGSIDILMDGDELTALSIQIALPTTAVDLTTDAQGRFLGGVTAEGTTIATFTGRWQDGLAAPGVTWSGACAEP